MKLLLASLQVNPTLAAQTSSFARHRNYGYASSQELLVCTHQAEFYYFEGSEE